MNEHGTERNMTGIVRTWVGIARGDDFIMEGQKPDNGDWMILRMLKDEMRFTIIPTLDETGTARIRVYRVDND